MNEYILEAINDLSFNDEEYPLSSEIKRLFIQYMSDNVKLDNGQRLLLKYPPNIKDKMFNNCHRSIIEFIECEKLLKKCYEIRDNYLAGTNNENNTTSYVKSICNIIVNMDRVNKYIMNVVNIHIDNISKYSKYKDWVIQNTNISEDIIEKWLFVYKIRSEFEHPEEIQTTNFSHGSKRTKCPEILIEGKTYDLLTLAEDAVFSIALFYKVIISTALLHSKYLILYTDEKGKNLYKE